MSSHVEVRPATTDDLSIVLSVLDEAADWLSARGIRRWPAAFDPSWILPDLRAGETWPVLAAGSPVATVTLASADRLWPNDARAGYVHRLARRRDAPNLGDAVLSWVAEQVASRGRDLIRLDCVASNQALRATTKGAASATAATSPLAVPPATAPRLGRARW